MTVQPLRINVAEALQGKWEHVVLTTFGLDLGFFERAVLPLLPTTRGRIVLANRDHAIAHQADIARGGLVKSLNRDYLLGSIDLPGAAHAKIILLASENAGRLLVGSGNLGITGWGSGGELFTVYEFDPDDASTTQPFQAARNFLDGICELGAVSDFAASYLAEVWARVPWLTAGEGRDAGPVRHNLQTPLLQQFAAEARPYGEPDELVLYAPFHDPKAIATSELVDRLRPKTATVLVQPNQTSVDPEALAAVRTRFPQLVVRAVELRDRPTVYLHAKFVLARFGRSALCLVGSANISVSALLRLPSEANAEVSSLLLLEDAAVDSLLAPLAITDPVDNLTTLGVSYRPGDAVLVDEGAERVVEAVWDGTVLRLVVWRWVSGRDTRWLLVGPALVQAPVLRVTDDPARPGHATVEFQIGDLPDAVLARAVPVALYIGDERPSPDARHGALGGAVYCVVQPALTHRLQAKPLSARIPDIGRMDFIGEDELMELLQALQGTMVYNRQTLVEASPAGRSSGNAASSDDALAMKYDEIDFVALQAAARVRQYRLAHELRGRHSSAVPSDIELALRSIREAVTGVIGARQPAHTSSAVKWEILDESDHLIDADDAPPASETETDPQAAEQSEEAVEIEQESERRWSQAARTRHHWRSFIGRFVEGLTNQSWQQVAGTSVLLANYEIFSHLLQRLHAQPWVDPAFSEYLIDAQLATHSFVWGLPDRPGWLAGLSDDEVVLVRNALVEARLAVRLTVDLAGCSTVTARDQLSTAESVQRRVGVRDLARAALTHPLWTQLIELEQSFAQAVVRMASDLCRGSSAGYWPEPPSYPQLMTWLDGLMSYRTMSEFERDVVSRLDQKATLRITDVLLGPDTGQPRTHDLQIQGLMTPMERDTALSVMSLFTAFRPGLSHRVHDGTTRLLARPEGKLLWSAGAGGFEVVEPGPVPATPERVAIDHLKSLHAETESGVA